jgi:hypothetical protein
VKRAGGAPLVCAFSDQEPTASCLPCKNPNEGEKKTNAFLAPMSVVSRTLYPSECAVGRSEKRKAKHKHYLGCPGPNSRAGPCESRTPVVSSEVKRLSDAMHINQVQSIIPVPESVLQPAAQPCWPWTRSIVPVSCGIPPLFTNCPQFTLVAFLSTEGVSVQTKSVTPYPCSTPHDDDRPEIEAGRGLGAVYTPVVRQDSPVPEKALRILGHSVD